jgi:hypothetical protein
MERNRYWTGIGQFGVQPTVMVKLSNRKNDCCGADALHAVRDGSEINATA